MNLVQRPVKVVGVLHLLKVRYRHPSRIGQKIGDHKDVIGMENFVRFRGGRSIGQLAGDPAFDLGGIRFGDHVLQGRREKDGDLHFQKLLIGDGLRPRKSLQASFL